MTKIAINCCWGGFCLSAKAVQMLFERGYKVSAFGGDLPRNHEELISVIEELGEAASSPGEKIRVVEIPDDVKDWYINDYDGLETICEGRQWGYEG